MNQVKFNDEVWINYPNKNLKKIRCGPNFR